MRFSVTIPSEERRLAGGGAGVGSFTVATLFTGVTFYDVTPLTGLLPGNSFQHWRLSCRPSLVLNQESRAT